jgi:hypothetical protein
MYTGDLAADVAGSPEQLMRVLCVAEFYQARGGDMGWGGRPPTCGERKEGRCGPGPPSLSSLPWTRPAKYVSKRPQRKDVSKPTLISAVDVDRANRCFGYCSRDPRGPGSGRRGPVSGAHGSFILAEELAIRNRALAGRTARWGADLAWGGQRPQLAKCPDGANSPPGFRPIQVPSRVLGA